MNKTSAMIILLIAVALSAPFSVKAQSGEGMPVYIVQPGDTINTIAIRFGISANDLINANDLPNPDILNVGTELRIPGVEGFSGTLTTDVAGLGATLTGLSRQYQIPIDLLVRLNRITSPAEIFIGSTLVLPSIEDVAQLSALPPLRSSESLLEKAIVTGVNPWLLIETNAGKGSSDLLPQENLYISSETTSPGGEFNSLLVKNITIAPLPLVQGKTEVLFVTTTQPASISGELNGIPLTFVPLSENDYVAIQGIHAMAPTGLAEISLQVDTPEMESFSFQQAILVESGYYPQDPVLNVPQETIDPALTAPEDQQIREAVAPVNPERYWDETFQQPVDDPACIKSWFGNRRSYNGGPYNYFHTGVDYGVCATLNIYAPAPGRVVFNEELTVRGIATIIDHGWGVYSGFWHQSKSLVKVGDMVEAGQLIGEIGKTGRVTGPHLHWEVWANGVQVEPLDWLDNLYPEDFLAASQR